MSSQFNPLINSIQQDLLNNIEDLDLPIVQKQHIRILAHCLQTFKNILVENEAEFLSKTLLMKWCVCQSKILKEPSFAELLFEQMNAAYYKLENFSNNIGKTILELEFEDLINLVSAENE